TDVVVRNVDRDRDRRGPRRGGDRPLGSAGNDGSRRDGVVAVSASRTSPAPARSLSSPARAGSASRSSPAPPRGRSSPAGAGSASRSSPASPRGVLDALPQAPIRRRTRGAAPSASRYAHHSTRHAAPKRGSRIILRQGVAVAIELLRSGLARSQAAPEAWRRPDR